MGQGQLTIQGGRWGNRGFWSLHLGVPRLLTNLSPGLEELSGGPVSSPCPCPSSLCFWICCFGLVPFPPCSQTPEGQAGGQGGQLRSLSVCGGWSLSHQPACAS